MQRPPIAAKTRDASASKASAEASADATWAEIRIQHDDASDASGGEHGPRRIESGTHVGPYIVLEHVGAGAMGSVYSAFDPRLARRVALKLLHPTRSSRDPVAARARLLREAQALAKLGDPHVVTVHDVGEFEGQVFIAMEFIDGPTLGAWLGQPRTLAEVVSVLIRAGEGLAAAHRAGLIHRDFKPDNVMLDERGRPRVMDFGLARAHEARGSGVDADVPDLAVADLASTNEDPLTSSLTRTGAILGTPAYMSPEQHLGRLADARSDQFSFCVTAFEAVYGLRPFAGTQLAQLSLAVTSGEIVDVPRDRHVPGWIDAALRRGLAADPSARFQDMDALLTALRDDPRLRRRRGLALGLGLASLGAVVGVLAVTAPDPEQPCSGADQALREVWSSERAAELRAHLEGSGRSYAGETAARLVADLDRYASRWQTIHRDACEATHVRQERSVEVMDRQMLCLGHARTGLRELVTTLSATEGARLDAALDAGLTSVDALPELGACADLDRVLAGLRPPAANMAPQVEALREQLARALALRSTGDPSQAMALLSEIEQASADLGDPGYPPLAAELALATGLAELDAGRYRESATALERAHSLAVEHGHERVAAEAAAELIYVAGYTLAEHRVGETWAVSAAAWSLRVDPEGPLRAQVLHNTGVLHDAQGNGLSGPFYREALAIRRRAFGDDHPLVARSIHNLGNLELDAGRFDVAAAHYAEARDIYTAALGAGHPDVAGTLNNLGLAYREARRYADSAAQLREANAIYEATLGPSHPHLAQSLDNLALSLVRAGQLDEAEAAARRSLAIRLETLGPEHPDVGDTRATLAELFLRQGRLDAALAEADAAVETYEAHFGPDQPQLGVALDVRGQIHLAAGRLEPALVDLRRAVDLRARVTCPASRRGESLAHLARALHAHGDAEAAASAKALALAAYAEAGPAWAEAAAQLEAQPEPKPP